MKSMLSCLREIRFKFNILKCEFHITEIKFFGLVIIPDKIKMNLKKIIQIKNWTKSKNGKDLKEIRGFLEFINFYRRFIKDFIKITRPLYNLLIKKSSDIWNNKCNGVFKKLKKTITIKSMMMYFDRTKKTFLKCDSSNLVSRGILSQLNNKDWLRFITYFSQSLNLAQRNYIIYNKEILAIVRCFKKWQFKLLLISEDKSILVIINYKIFKYFIIIKQLNRRQACWIEFLFQFNFKISY